LPRCLSWPARHGRRCKLTTEEYAEYADRLTNGDGADGETPGGPPPPPSNRFRWEPLTAAELDAGDFGPKFGIKKHLVLLQPKFMIGGSKTMKRRSPWMRASQPRAARRT